MQWTHEHQQLSDLTKQWVEKSIDPMAAEWEKKGLFPARDLFKQLGGLGLLGISKPTQWGGMGLDFSYEIAFAEQMGAAESGGVALAIGVQTNMATPALARYGSDFLKHEFLAPSIAGDLVASIAVSEPHAGSDVAKIKTSARKSGGDYIISGSKMWITNATQADYFCTLVTTSDDSKHHNKSLVIIPATAKGVSVGQPLNKLGMRSSDTAPVFFDDVRVPQTHCIGKQGEGFIYQMQQFQEERLYGVAMGLKSMENCIQITLEYANTRMIFDKPLLSNQSVLFTLAELQTEIEALRALLYRATAQYVNGVDVTQLTSMAKLKAGRLNREVADRCLQYWGAMGYMEESLINRRYRDLRLTSIGGGADEIMLSIIGKSLVHSNRS